MAWTEGITEENFVDEITAIAEAAINTYRICTSGVSPNEVKQATSGLDYPIGISRDASENPTTLAYNADAPVNLAVYGIAYLEMYSNGFRDDRVMATAGGLGMRHVAQDGVWILGNATKGWVNGEIIPIIIDRFVVGDFTESA